MKTRNNKTQIHRAPARFLILALVACTIACNEMIQVDPPKNQLVRESVFSDEGTALSAISGLYYRLGGGGFAGGTSNSVTYFATLSSDEAIYFSTSENFLQINRNAILPTNTIISAVWTNCYSQVYYTNLLIENLAASNSLSQSFKNKLTGEAKFIRAFTYFYLTNLFGDVPYTTTTDYRINAALTRTEKAKVYEAIELDLLEAYELLSEEYPSSGRVRPNKSAARALLARVYLYRQEWSKAETYATQVINNNTLYKVDAMNNAFRLNSTEAIWQIIPSNSPTKNYTNEGNNFIITGTPTGLILRNAWIDSQFEANDQRKVNWVGTRKGSFGTAYYPYKFKENFANATSSEYSMALRLAEQFLIRAEARTQLNNLEGAKQDLNIIRTRAGLPATSAATKDEMMQAILQERKQELFAEWGHRWFDLIRTGKINEVMTPLKPNWTADDVLFPIPESEILINKGLTQNPNY